MVKTELEIFLFLRWPLPPPEASVSFYLFLMI